MRSRTNVFNDCSLACLFMHAACLSYISGWTEGENAQATPLLHWNFQFNQLIHCSHWLTATLSPFLLLNPVKIPSGQSPHHLQCIQSKIYTKSKLLDGANAGRFTDVGRVENAHICSRLCCEDPSCDLAYMFSRSCFLLRCNNERSCRTLPDEEAMRTNSSFERSIQYIIKRKYGIRLRDGKGNIY